MLSEHERNYGLGMDALLTVCSRNRNGIMVWAWMLWSSYALPTRTEVWFGHGCSGQRMLFQHERKYGLGIDALVTVCSSNTNGSMVWAWMLWSAYALPTRTELWFGHRCSGHRMLFQHERNYGLGVDALVTVCSRNTNGIMVCMGMFRSIKEYMDSRVRGVRFAGSWGSGVRGFVGFKGSQSCRGSRVSFVRGFAVFVGSQGSRVCKFTDAGSRARGLAGSGVGRFAGSRVRGFAGSRVRAFAVFAGSRGSRVRGVRGFAGSRVRGFAGSRVRGFAGSRVRGFAGSRVRGFAGSRGSRVRAFAGSRVRGFAGSRVRGSAGSRVREVRANTTRYYVHECEI